MNKAIKNQNDRCIKHCLPELKKFIKNKRKKDPSYGWGYDGLFENILVYQVEPNSLNHKELAKNKTLCPDRTYAKKVAM